MLQLTAFDALCRVLQEGISPKDVLFLLIWNAWRMITRSQLIILFYKRNYNEKVSLLR